jgi:hypothetical protein
VSHKQFGHADDAVHRGADLVAHVGQEGRFCPVRRLGRLAGSLQRGLLVTQLGDVGAQSDTAAVRGDVVGFHDPAPGRQLAFAGLLGLAETFQPVGQPFLLAPLGLGDMAVLQAVAQQILERSAGDHRLGAVGEHVAVALVAGQETFLPVEKDKAVGQSLDRGPDAHLFGDVEDKADHVAVAGAAVDQPDPAAVRQLDRLGFHRVFVQPGAHAGDPGLGLFALEVDDADVGGQAHQLAIGGALRDPLAGKERQVGRVRGDQLQVAVEHGESVADGVDRIPQPPFGHHGGGVGAFQIVQEAAVLALQFLGLGPGGMHDLALLDDLVRQRPGMQRQLFVGGEQLARLLLQQPFRCQPPAPFLRQSFRKVHPAADVLPAPPERRGRAATSGFRDYPAAAK